MWGFTGPAGLNTNMADWSFSHASVTPQQLKEIWTVARRAAAQEPMPSTTYRNNGKKGRSAPR